MHTMISGTPGQVTFVSVKSMWNDEPSFVDLSFTAEGVNIFIKDDKNTVTDTITLNPMQAQIVKNLLEHSDEHTFF